MELIIDLLKKFVSIDTTSSERKNFDLMAKIIKEEAEKLGLVAEIVVDEKKIPHVIVKLPMNLEDKKKVLFVTHYDVVPPGDGWDFDPFKPFEEMGRLYGRGAADDKSGIVAALVAFKEALELEKEPKINPILVVAGGEETGEGSDFFRSLQGDLAIILDVGPEAISVGASGVVRAYITVKTKQCHSAYPFSCKNAIYSSISVIRFLRSMAKKIEKKILSKYPAVAHYKRLPARMSITMINAGIAENVIPGECKIVVDRRTIPEEDIKSVADDLKKKIEHFAKKKKINVGVEVKPLIHGWVTNNKKIVETIKDIVEGLIGQPIKVAVELGGTDGVWFIDRMPVIQFGALRAGTNIHGINEFVYLDDVVLVKNFVKSIIFELDF
ncbi:MAG: M20/M25/M40 family metallo-hydrolase [Candidatus Njordarchaeota archaeon]